MEIMKLTIKEEFHPGTDFFSFSYHKITLFEKKYDLKLITLIKPLVSLDRFLKFKMQMYKLLFVLTLFRSFA